MTSFRTRVFARELPQRLEDRKQLNDAVAILVALRGGGAASARERLRHAAERANIPASEVATIIMVVYRT